MTSQETQQVLDGSRRWWVECADCLSFLRSLPPACVQVCVTSPLFWRMHSGPVVYARPANADGVQGTNRSVKTLPPRDELHWPGPAKRTLGPSSMLRVGQNELSRETSKDSRVAPLRRQREKAAILDSLIHHFLASIANGCDNLDAGHHGSGHPIGVLFLPPVRQFGVDAPLALSQFEKQFCLCLFHQQEWEKRGCDLCGDSVCALPSPQRPTVLFAGMVPQSQGDRRTLRAAGAESVASPASAWPVH